MKKMKILMTADLHMGDRMYGLKEREDDVYSAFDRVCSIAKSSGVDAMIIAGDAFDTSRPPAAAVARLRGCIDRIGIRVYGIEGNHDRVGTGEWLGVCGVEDLYSGDYDSELGIYGIGYARPSELVDRLESLASYCESNDVSIPVLVLHCGFAEMGDPFAAELSFERIMPILRRIGTHTVCVGHIHVHMVKSVTFDGYTVTFIQPGSIEVGSLNEEREKFVYIADFDESGLRTVSEARIKTRPILETNIDTRDDYDRFVASAGERNVAGALNIVRVNPDIDDCINGIERALHGVGAIFRILPSRCPVPLVPEEDRSNRLALLENVIESIFDKGSDEYELIVEMLRCPEKTADTAEKYLSDAKNTGDV